MHEVQVDVQKIGFVSGRVHDVAVPNFLGEGGGVAHNFLNDLECVVSQYVRLYSYCMDSISGVGVVDKVVAVLRSLEANGPSSLVELQEATGMPRATAHRLASALEDHGLVRRETNGKFALGMGLVSMGKAASSALPLMDIARPVLDSLRTTTGESVQLYVHEGDGRRCVVSLESPHGLRWIVPEGSLLPLDAGSAGHVLAGARIDKRGWIQSIGEREAGVASVSAPVVNAQGNIIAAISVSGPIERLSRKPGERHGTAVVNAAQALGKLL